MIWVLLIIVIVFIAYRLTRKPCEIELIGNGEFEYEIVGESNYQRNIKKALNIKRDRYYKDFEALLMLDDGNKYDDKAVEVMINFKTVGYLSKKDARNYRRLLDDLGKRKCIGVCRGILRGGGDLPYFGVFLDFNPAKTKKHYLN